MLMKRFFILSLLFVSTLVFASNDRLDLIHADKNTGKKIGSEQLRILSGNVHFVQDTLSMFCDEAVFYEIQEKLEFRGNVLIDNRQRKIRADKIVYYPKTKLAVCTGKVKITGENDSLYAEHFTYNFEHKDASGRKNLYILDRTNNVQIWGDRGVYDQNKNYSMVEQNARLMKIDTASSDTLIIKGRRLEYFDVEDNRRAVVQDSVIILQGGLKAQCDSAVYYPDLNIGWLKMKPIAWYENNELSGVEMKVHFDSLKVRDIYVYGDGIAKSLADSAKGRYNELKGKSIEFQIENDKPKTIIARDNAISLYYLKEKENDQGSNFATSDSIFIHFKNGELDSINIIGGSEGIFYPENYKGEMGFE